MKLTHIIKYLIIFGVLFLTVENCSSEDRTSNEQSLEDDFDDNDEDTEPDNSEVLNSRFVFNENLVIEHSWNTGGCDSPPCDTDEDALVNVFENTLPNDPYFYMEDDLVELNLECQQEKGRRAEFKQISEGPLTSYSKMEFEAVYYDVPDDGFTIAQVHNRGGNSNKPFFRLELHDNKLETVIRKDPEVSSNQTTFNKVDYPFLNGVDYNQFPLKVILEKSGGYAHITVMQNNTIILDQSFQPDATTDWVNDTSISNGYYLKAGAYNAANTHTEHLILGYTTFKFETEDLN
ncbi:polysaccharide lyase family 7 protein [Winogradskyella immobilis]|uniref:Polysaccharide lyase family 7 protein n=1 Tax=Winogradskyella immobilis TaxID=2816852 RepID=A0ABS8EKC5_9FLAO|nr:polysaccharide lyase family 7 protein [Winogradskyella immobilis]MCC1483371.1 polysaccharide lyase family 7 protein [Winogradskyella immobilis]MCG0015465.1 polysaccharide lyase family 7 protein [Winogradskyella immobilis]